MTSTTIKERPILFTGPMVLAILDGKKTQTRRIVKCKGQWTVEGGWPCFEDEYGDWQQLSCKYGKPGDRLWVRETWQCFRAGTDIVIRASSECPGVCSIAYAAAEDQRLKEYPAVKPVEKWRPSIFMPRWASRIDLEITGIRVERLQDISRGDAMGEGCSFANIAGEGDPREWYRDLWESINGPGSWAANPWVWVVEFKKAVTQ